MRAMPTSEDFEPPFFHIIVKNGLVSSQIGTLGHSRAREGPFFGQKRRMTAIQA
jgi:hypothetical protein